MDEIDDDILADEAEFESPEAARKKIEESAMRLLVRREHSVRELSEKLRKRGFGHRMVAEVLVRLKEQNLQSDARYAESLSRSRLSQGYGPIRIEYELSQQGVEQSLIDRALLDLEVDWLERTRQIFEKRFGRVQTDSENENDSEAAPEREPNPESASKRNKVETRMSEKAKQWRYLTNRGFRNEDIRAVLS